MPRKTCRPKRRSAKRALNALVDCDLLLPMYPRAEEYIFEQTLVVEIARDSLLKTDRKRLHRLVAETLERLYAHELDEHAAELVEHFAEAGDDARIMEYAPLAGDRAAHQFANAEALSYYTQALEAAMRLGAPATRLKSLYLRRGREYEVMNDSPGALANYEELVRAARECGDALLEHEGIRACARVRAGM